MSRIAATISIAVMTCAVYIPALRNGFIWDDNAHVTRPELRSLTGLSHIWFDLGATQQYYPLLHSAFWVEQKLWGEQAWAYHLMNVLEHAGVACLVFLVLQKLKIPGAYFAALLFAVHPIQVESVAWITEQKNTLSALFYFSAALAYLNYVDARQPKQYALATILFVLGLLTKTVVATLPAALLVIFWWQRGRLSWRNDVQPLLPWFVLGVAAGLFTAWVERNLIGAEGAAYDLTVLQRFLLSGRITWFYACKLIWPSNLLFVYPRWDIVPSVWWQWLFPAAAAVVLIGLWMIRGRYRGPLACWLFYVGTLFPVLGFFNVYPFIYSFVADHFQYLAGLGWIVLFAGGVASFVSQQSVSVRRFTAVLGTVAITTLAALTWRQIPIYADNVTLFEHTIQGNPAAWMAYDNLGFELLQKGAVDAAVAKFQQSLQLNPTNAAALVNMGLASEARNNISEAIRWYQSAIDHHPDYFLAYYHLGHALADGDHPEQSISQYTEAIRLRPDYAPSHFNLAAVLAQVGRTGDAIEQFNAALRLNPGDADSHHNLAFLLAATGQADEAIAHYREALDLRPNFPEAQFNWANTIAQDHPSEAIQHYQAAIALRPDYAEAYANLATTFAQAGNRIQAQSTIQKAIDLARAQNNESLVQQLEGVLKSYKSP